MRGILWIKDAPFRGNITGDGDKPAMPGTDGRFQTASGRVYGTNTILPICSYFSKISCPLTALCFLHQMVGAVIITKNLAIIAFTNSVTWFLCNVGVKKQRPLTGRGSDLGGASLEMSTLLNGNESE